MLSLEKQEAYRRRYAVEHPGWSPATHVYRDRVAAHLSPGVRLLDLGCGRGGIVEELHDRIGLAVGVDSDMASLQEHRLPALPRVCGQAGALPFPDESFDLVCCSWVLEHLPDPERVLKEVARVLAPGGCFLFVTPNRRHPLVGVNQLLGWTRGKLVARLYGRADPDTFPACYRANSPACIRPLLRAAGLEMGVLIPVGDPTYLAFSDLLYRLACLLERLIPPSLRVHLVGEAFKPWRSSPNPPETAPAPRR